MIDIQTRAQAIESRQKYYVTGKECKHGHKSKRITMDGSCYQCRMEGQKKERDRIRKILNGEN